MARWNMRSTLAGLLLLAGSVVRAEECQCSPGKERITYIVVEMPEQPPAVLATTTGSAPAPVFSTLAPTATATVTATATGISYDDDDEYEAPKPVYPPVVIAETYNPPINKPHVNKPVHEKPPIVEDAKPENTTHTFTPCAAPNVDRGDIKNLVPAHNVSLYYAAADENEPGTINMTLAFNNPAVVLDHVEAVTNVTCGVDVLTVTFATLAAFDEAVEDWDIEQPFILITGSAGNCAEEFERGFFVVEDVESDKDELTVTVTATKGELPDLAGELEMDFQSMPAASLTRRLTLNPKYALTFAEGLPERTTIFSDGRYVEVTAEEAWFSSTLTFSGKLKYNFWGFRLEALYFDIDAEFDSSAAISASIQAAFTEAIRYQPDALAYSLVDVPGVISLGPGIAFGLAVDVKASAAVGLYAGVDISLPAGNVHVDFLDASKTGTSGWDPVYNSYANISQAADVSLDIGADVTVMLQFKLLGGLVDLSSGVTASPGFANSFKLRGEQNAIVNGSTTAIDAGIDVPTDAIECADTNGIEFASDFFFSVSAYATKWFNRELYRVRLPIVDYCLSF